MSAMQSWSMLSTYSCELRVDHLTGLDGEEELHAPGNAAIPNIILKTLHHVQPYSLEVSEQMRRKGTEHQPALLRSARAPTGLNF